MLTQDEKDEILKDLLALPDSDADLEEGLLSGIAFVEENPRVPKDYDKALLRLNYALEIVKAPNWRQAC